MVFAASRVALAAAGLCVPRGLDRAQAVPRPERARDARDDRAPVCVGAEHAVTRRECRGFFASDERWLVQRPRQFRHFDAARAAGRLVAARRTALAAGPWRGNSARHARDRCAASAKRFSGRRLAAGVQQRRGGAFDGALEHRLVCHGGLAGAHRHHHRESALPGPSVQRYR